MTGPVGIEPFVGPLSVGGGLFSRFQIAGTKAIFESVKKVYSDSGTTFAVEGIGVQEWHDQTANAYVLTQTRKPTYKTDLIKGEHAVRFAKAGGGDLMTVTFNAPLSQPNTIVLVAKLNDATEAHVLVDGIASTDRNLIYRPGTDEWEIFAGTRLRSGFATDTNLHIFTAIFNGGSSKLYLDGAEIASGNAGAQSLTGLTVGASYNDATYNDGDIYAIDVINGEISEGDRESLEYFYAQRYGVTLS